MTSRRGAPQPLKDRLGWRLLVESRRLGVLPWPALRLLGRLSGRAAALLRRRVLRRSIVNLKRAFPDWPRSRRIRTAWASAAHQGEAWADWVRLARSSPERRLSWIDVSSLEDPIRRALEARTGALVVTGWLGHAEGLAAALAAATGEILMITRRSRPHLRRDPVSELRRICAVRAVSFSSGRMDGLPWLKMNRVVLVVADGDAGREGVFLPWFGSPASVTDLPVHLAAQSGAPLVAAFCLKDGGGGWRTRSETIEVPKGADAATRQAALARWISLLEAEVRAHPEQHVWNHRRWRTRPARDPAPLGGRA